MINYKIYPTWFINDRFKSGIGASKFVIINYMYSRYPLSSNEIIKSLMKYKISRFISY